MPLDCHVERINKHGRKEMKGEQKKKKNTLTQRDDGMGNKS